MDFRLGLLLRVIGAALAIVIVRLLLRLYQVRSYVRSLQKQGLPMPPHHWLLGHLPISASVIQGMPPLAHGVYVGDQIRQRYPHLKSAFYLDIWPFGNPLLVVMNPDMVAQFTQTKQLPKDKGLRNFLRPLTGEADLVTLEGSAWKYWRSIFNPGFSVNHIMTLVPGMVEDAEIFRDIFKRHAANGQILYLEEASLNLTIDLIGRVVMDHTFNTQTAYNDMTTALREQILWCTTGMNFNPLEYINIFRPLVHWYNTRRMDRYLNREFSSRYNAIRENTDVQGKSVVDLALKAYLKENPESIGIPDDFKRFAIGQIKLFIFAGHDTTSSAAVFTYHLLSQHLAALAKVREEHDHVFGTDLSTTGAVISAQPHLLNHLPYTLATIKESLRIYPTVAALRQGQPGFSLTGPDAQRFPTAGFILWGDHYATHHNPHHWPRPEEFLPERWLVPDGHPLYPPKNAWRPFERGPRNCIGQELALTEVKLMLAMTIREFDVRDAYEEFDAMKGYAKGRSVNGQRAYMMLRGGGHPADHYPCKVALARG